MYIKTIDIALRLHVYGWIPVQAWLELSDPMATSLFEIVNQTMKDKKRLHILSHA
jgi:hypothetical protein